ncbi:MAG: type II toxin-antitoxin system prevent-host-death family antitoxin [Thermomicrobiales bacterium]|nr:type II toxin-antitoxin system prevent-host-death family antitoxin [Thermomicrobiales bacterium]
MTTITLKTLEEQVAEIVAQVAAGDTVVITDAGRPIVTMTPTQKSRLQELREAGMTIPATGRLRDLPRPQPGPSLSDEVARMRSDERF